MIKWITVFKTSTWARVGVLTLALLVLAWMFGLSPQERQTAGLKLASLVGYMLPAVVLGAAWGWIRLSLRQWGWATAVLLVVTGALAYRGASLNEHYKALDKAAETSATKIPEPWTDADGATHYPGLKN